MIEESGQVRLIFTVICGDLNQSCPDETKLTSFREKINNQPNLNDPLDLTPLVEQLNTQISNPSSISGTNATILPHLLRIGRYRMGEPPVGGDFSLDMFTGLMIVDRKVFDRDRDSNMLKISPQERSYLNETFRRIFQELKKDDNDDFSWLTWTIVPLVEAFDGRFNPIGMGGSGEG